MTGFVQNMRDELALGVRLALTLGALVGAGLGVALVAQPHGQLVVGDAQEAAAAIGLAASVLALVCGGAVVPLALALAALDHLRPGLLDLLGRPRLYASATLLGMAFVATLLWLGFVGLRDVTSARGLLSGGAAAGTALLLLVLVNARQGRPPTGRRGPRLLGTLVLAAALVGIALGTHGMLERAPEGAGAAASADPVSDPGGAPPVWPVPGAALPPIILVSIDTLRADHLSSYGYARETTPFLDALASDGARFPEARSPAPWTLPSHATMLTGLYPASHGARFFDNSRFFNSGYRDVLEARHETLAEMLAGAGYRTAGFTSTRWLERDMGFGQGFDVLDYDFEINKAATLVDKGIAWLDAGDRPPFLFLHFYDVHEYASPPEYDGLWRDPGYDGPLASGPLNQKVAGNFFESLSEEDLAYLRARYDGALRWVDEELGRLWRHLQATGRYDDALIIVTSDHGEEFLDHGGTGHGFNLYEEQLRVPMIVKPPSSTVVAEETPAAPVGLIDVVPTVLDYAGLPERPGVEGLSMRPMIESGAHPRRSLFAESSVFVHTCAVVRDGMKLVDNRVPPTDTFNARLWFNNLRTYYKYRPVELFDLTRDPSEQDDARAARPVTAARLAAELTGFLRRRQASTRADDGTVTSEDFTEEMRQLGYLSGDDETVDQ